MKSPTVSRLIGAVAAWVLVSPLWAHHSFAMFDMDKESTIVGTVKEFQYTNPHSWLVIVAPQDGKDVEWSFEAEGPSTMMRAGIRPSSLHTGDKVTVEAHPMKDGRPGGSWISVTKADGTVLAPRSGRVLTPGQPGTAAPAS